MSIKAFKPTTSTLRGTKLEDRSHLRKDSGPKSLTIAKRKKSGRNNQGRITMRHRGGGVKRRIRVVDFKRDKFDIPAKVIGFYFDPNRSAHLALLQYADGEKRYIIAPKNLKEGDTVISGEEADISVGNAMKIGNVPPGSEVHCVESVPGKGAVYGRSAGDAIIAQGKDSSGKYVQIKMPSREIRLVNVNCMATLGRIGNEDRMHMKYGKAGRRRLLGWRPSVRGKAMHPGQHPHGGGEGKGVIGKAKDIWGHKLHKRTRKNKKTENMIIKRRRSKQRPHAKK